MTTPNTVDVLDDLTAEPSSDTVSTTTDNESTPTNPQDNTANDPEGDDPEGNESDEETFESIPPEFTLGENLMSITDFAAHVSMAGLSEAIRNGEPPSRKHYVVPQDVYQTVRAAKNRIPHIKVKASGDEQARVYIKVDEATPWWFERRERLSTRGSGTTRASSRTPEDNLKLLTAAAHALAHAKTRAELWAQRVPTADAKVDKYRTFLAEQDVSEDDVARAIQNGIDQYNAEQTEKANKSKKNDNEDSNE